MTWPLAFWCLNTGFAVVNAYFSNQLVRSARENVKNARINEEHAKGNAENARANLQMYRDLSARQGARRWDGPS